MPSSSRRAFYDPKQPRLLTDEEISALTPAECDAACLQVDQILVNILQNIDADFGKSHRIITDKILPDLERYGEASKGIWEGLKFWQGFFEASADVKLSGHNEVSETVSTIVDNSHQLDDQSTETFRPDNECDGDRPVGVIASESTFETLKQDIRQNLSIPTQAGRPLDLPSVHKPDDSHQTGSSASLRRPPHWHDISMDSPDTTLQMPIPKDLSILIEAQSSNSLDSDISLSSFSAPEGQAANKTAGPEASESFVHKSTHRGGKILLHQALLRETMSGKHKRQTISTPAKSWARRNSNSGRLPPEIADPNWNGLTDLRKVPLDGLVGSSMTLPQARFGDDKAGAIHVSNGEGEESLRAGISPPQTIHFSVPRSKLAQTPFKEAARLVTRDVLETARLRAGYANPIDLEDSPPLEPPSVLREWRERGYESLYKFRADEEAQPSDAHATSIAEGRASDATSAGPSRDLSVSRALIDLRESDTSSHRSTRTSQRQLSQSDDPFNEPSTVKPPTRKSGFGGPSNQLQYKSASHKGLDQSHDSPPDSPTLFGIRHDHQPSNNPTRKSTSLEVPNIPAQDNRPTERASQQFVPMRPEQMDTFFGGNLLESECFEPSPLQGKRIRYTHSKDQ